MRKRRFDTILKANKTYSELVQKKPLTARESALVQCAITEAEREIGRLFTIIENKKGVIALEQERTKFAMAIGSIGHLLKDTLILSATPFNEMPRKFKQEKLEDDRVINASEVKPNANNETRDEKSKTDNILPKPLNYFIKPIAKFLSSFSPITASIILIIVVSGSIAYAKNKYGDIEKSYKAQITELDSYREKNEEYAKAKKENKALIEEKAQIVGRMNALNEERKVDLKDIENLKSEKILLRKQKDAEIEKLRFEHKKQVDSLRSGLDESTKALVKKLEKEKEQQDKEIKEKTKEISDIRIQSVKFEKDLEAAEKEIKRQKDLLAAETKLLESKERLLETLQGVEIKYKTVTAFVFDQLGITKTYLLDSSKKKIVSNRRAFRIEYRKLYEANKNLFRELAFKQF